MAQVDCANLDVNDKGMKKPKLDGAPPSKKLKQARLPFQPLEQKPQLIPNGPQVGSTKKRKLSVEMESPTAKAPKRLVPDKPLLPDNEPEVSSSSETENLQLHILEKGSKHNTLDRFIKTSSQEEISSTNMECIDLTDENIDPEIKSDEETKKDDLSMLKYISKGVTETLAAEPEELKQPPVNLPEDSFKVLSDKPEKDSDKDSSKPESTGVESHQDAQLNSVACVLLSPLHTKLSTAEAQALGLVSQGPVEADKSLEMTSEREEEQDESAEVSQNDNSVTEESELQESEADKTSDSITDAETSSVVKDDSPGTAPQTPVLNGRPLLVSTPKSDSVSSSLTTPKRKPPGPSAKSSTKKAEKEALRQKIKEQKEKEREQRIQQKEKERLEKEQERLEKKKQRDEEKAEKEKQKKEEKEKREKERLEKLQQKEDEKKKKQELIDAKIEEKKKKEEERKQKEEEKMKEDEEKARKREKVVGAFTSFFIKQKSSPPPKNKETSGLFMPFEPNKNMKLAPQKRRDDMTDEKRTEFDQSFKLQNCDDLYIKELKEGKTPLKNEKTWPRVVGLDEDVEIMTHDSEVVKKVTYRVKFLFFHENHRPPYYGTWRKCSKRLCPRNPLKQDNDLLDYEVDSDDEWEEEEPGESLSASEGEEEEEGEKVEEEEDGWMVPHGYLSEDEVDDEVSPELLKAQQQARAQAWEKELQEKKKPAMQTAIGCVWEGEDGQVLEAFQKRLEEFKAVCLLAGPILTSFNNLKKSCSETNQADAAGDKTSSSDKQRGQKRPVPEEAMPDLIRLLHGNVDGIQKLIKEFRMYWKQKTTGETTVEKVLDMSMEVEEEVEDGSNKVIKPEEDKVLDQSATNLDQSITLNEGGEATVAEEFSISKRQLELKIAAVAMREKRATFKKICWYVHDSVLKQYELQDITLPNSWEYVTKPARSKEAPKTPKTPKIEEPVVSGRKTPSILQFAQPMSPSQIAAMAPPLPVCSIKEKDEKTEESDSGLLKSPVPVKLVPSDQRSIMDFAKRLPPAPVKPVAVKGDNQNKKDKAVNEKKLQPMDTDSAPNQCVSPAENRLKDSDKTSAEVSPKAPNTHGLKLPTPKNVSESNTSITQGNSTGSARKQSPPSSSSKVDTDVIVID